MNKKLGKRTSLWSQLAMLVVTLALCDGLLSLSSCSSARLRYYLTPPRDRAALPDAVLGRRMSPFYPGHDRLGFRNAAVPDRSDLLAVGDSLTYGYAAPPDGSWPYHLQQLSGRVVYNAGVGGYGPLEYSVTIDKLMPLRPSTVLMGLYIGNDLANTYLSVYVDRRFPQLATHDAQVRKELTAANAATTSHLARRLFRLSPPDRLSLLERILAYSSLFSVGRNLYLAARGEVYGGDFDPMARTPFNPTAETFEAAIKRPGRVAYNLEPQFRTVFRDPEFLGAAVDGTDPRMREGRRIAKDTLLGVRDRLSTKGVRLIVVLLPYKPTVYADRLGDRRPSDLPPTFFNLAAMEKREVENFRQFLSANEIEFVDASAAMNRAFARGMPPYPETEDDHPNANGYRAIAEAILPVVTAAAPGDAGTTQLR